MIKLNKSIKVHFIGIGGIGMSGIAHLLLKLGFKVTGSDISESEITKKLQDLGAVIAQGHSDKNIVDQNVVVVSSAIDELNPEILEARKKLIPIIKRAEMLSELMRLKKGISIAGTHGKTTTTSFIATIMHECGYDPTHVIGGVVSNLKGHANLGKGDYLIAEADESDGSFLLLSPVLSVITNIDSDHMDFYGDFETLFNAFIEHANKVPFYGLCALNIDDENIKTLIEHMKKPFVTFGLDLDQPRRPDFTARNIDYQKNFTAFDLYHNETLIDRLKINLIGNHNIYNALGAIAVCSALDNDLKKIASSVSKLRHVGRRFETLYNNENLEIIDDYAHHPTEILTTLNALKQTRDHEIIAVFEPHRFSRTKECWEDFLHAFNSVDKLYLLAIYPASEKPIPGITSERLIEDINKLHPGLASKMQSVSDIKDIINQKKAQTILTLGAGSIGKNIRQFILDYHEK